jgi:hypothetical protein
LATCRASSQPSPVAGERLSDEGSPVGDLEDQRPSQRLSVFDPVPQVLDYVQARDLCDYAQ